jgi:hypothetical protein
MERTSENSSFIQLEGMHYLSCFPFFLPAKFMQAAAARRRRTRNERTRNERTRNERTRFLSFFYLSPNACTSPHTQCNECMPPLRSSGVSNLSLSLSLALSHINKTFFPSFFVDSTWPNG